MSRVQHALMTFLSSTMKLELQMFYCEWRSVQQMQKCCPSGKKRLPMHSKHYCIVMNVCTMYRLCAATTHHKIILFTSNHTNTSSVVSAV